MKIINEKVESSMINNLYYDEENNNAYIEFTSGKLGKYYGIPKKLYNGWIHSDSVGKFFHLYVKDKFSFKYPSEIESLYVKFVEELSKSNNFNNAKIDSNYNLTVSYTDGKELTINGKD